MLEWPYKIIKTGHGAIQVWRDAQTVDGYLKSGGFYSDSWSGHKLQFYPTFPEEEEVIGVIIPGLPAWCNCAHSGTSECLPSEQKRAWRAGTRGQRDFGRVRVRLELGRKCQPLSCSGHFIQRASIRRSVELLG